MAWIDIAYLLQASELGIAILIQIFWQTHLMPNISQSVGTRQLPVHLSHLSTRTIPRVVSVKRDKGGSQRVHGGVQGPCQGPYTVSASPSSGIAPSYLISPSVLLVLFYIHRSLSTYTEASDKILQNFSRQVNWNKNRILGTVFFFFSFSSLSPRKEKDIPNPTLNSQVCRPSSEQVLWALLFFDVFFCSKQMSDSTIKHENGTSQIILPFLK